MASLHVGVITYVCVCVYSLHNKIINACAAVFKAAG